MNTRSTIVLVVMSIALIFGYWFVGTLEVERQRIVQEEKRIFSFEGSDIIRLSITIRGGDIVEATRLDESTWELSGSLSHVMPNNPLWTNLADKVVPYLRNQRTIEASPDDLKLYALEDPPLSIVVETSGKELIQLDVGDPDPTRNNRYAKLASGEVFLLPANMAGVLYQSLDELRDKRVFPVVDYTIDQIHYTRFVVDDPDDGLEPVPGIEEDYVLGEDGKWRITQPIEAFAFQGEMRHLLNQIQFLNGENFIDSPDDPADFGLDPPWAKLTVKNTKENTAQTLALGWHDDMDDTGRMFASIVGNPSIFTIDAAFLSYLPEAPLDYREDHIFTGEAIKLASIEYSDIQRKLTLTNTEDAGWELTEPAYSDTDNIAVSNLIRALMLIVGDRFPDEEEIAQNFGEERIGFTFNFIDDTPSTHISIGNAVPDSNPVEFYVRQDFGSVVTIPFGHVQMLISDAFRFRKRELMPFNARTVTGLTLKLDGIDYSIAQKEGIWSVFEPEGHTIESLTDVATMFTALRNAMAIQIADPVPAADITGLDTPTLEASVTYLAQDGSMVIEGPIRLGNLIASASRQRFCTVSGRPETFYVDHGMIEDIRAGLKGIRPISP